MVVRESKTHDMHPADGGGATEACDPRPFNLCTTKGIVSAVHDPPAFPDTNNKNNQDKQNRTTEVRNHVDETENSVRDALHGNLEFTHCSPQLNKSTKSQTPV